MINKTEALARLAALEVEASNLRKVLEAPEPLPSMLPGISSASPDERVYRIDGLYGKFTASEVPTLSKELKGPIYFASKDQAQAYADAFCTMMLLRRQPGTQPAVQGKTQWLIWIDHDGVSFASSDMLINKLQRISPHFETREAVEAAITVVGGDRIMTMFKTFQHA